MKAIPTLLTTTPDEFIAQMKLFQQYFDRIQLDIADGKLVPNTTTQTGEIIKIMQKNPQLISRDCVFDFHLMVEDYESELQNISDIQRLGMKVNVALINAKHTIDIPSLSKRYNITIGLDIFPHTAIAPLANQYNLTTLKTLQVMTVEPGFQGSPFLPDMLTKIHQLREKNYKNEILIDGGVNDTTLPTILAAPSQPDVLCIGSYLTKAGEELEQRITELKKLE